MNKRQKTEAIFNQIKAGVRLTNEQVAFAHANNICLWGSVNYLEHEAAQLAKPEVKRIMAMPSVCDNFDVAAYQRKVRSFENARRRR